jgi:hypothetical protein
MGAANMHLPDLLPTKPALPLNLCTRSALTDALIVHHAADIIFAEAGDTSGGFTAARSR